MGFRLQAEVRTGRGRPHHIQAYAQAERRGIRRHCSSQFAVRFRFLIAGALGLSGVPAAAAVPDCPLARQPYSIRSPMLDVMLNRRAKAAVDRIAPDLVTTLTRNFGGGDLPPGFAAITTPESFLRMRPDGAVLGRKLNAVLRQIPLTPQAISAR